MGELDGTNAVRVATSTGVLHARTIRRRAPADQWSGDFLAEARGSELQPNVLDARDHRIGVRAPIHIEIPPGAPDPLPRVIPPAVVPRARLRRAVFYSTATPTSAQDATTCSCRHRASKWSDRRSPSSSAYVLFFTAWLCEAVER